MVEFNDIIKAIGIEPYYRDWQSDIVIYNADCRDILPLIPDKSIDLVLTDPPYNFEVVGGAFKSTNPSTNRNYLADLIDMGCGVFDPKEHFVNWVRVSRANSGVIFCNRFLVDKYITLARANNLIFDIHIMGKNNPPPFKNKQFLNDVEYIITIRNGGSTFNDDLNYDLYRKITMVNCQQDNDHPAQKDISVISKYALIFSNPEDIVLDPFLGSGTTAVACKVLGRKCIGIELEEKYCAIAVKRLAQGVLL
jgi:site-specific DNA-methyltransferase (adenine-specific)